MYSTGVGLVIYGRDHDDNRYFRVREENIYTKVKVRMEEWFKDVFS